MDSSDLEEHQEPQDLLDLRARTETAETVARRDCSDRLESSADRDPLVPRETKVTPEESGLSDLWDHQDLQDPLETQDHQERVVQPDNLD